MGASLLRHSLGWKTSRTHNRNRSCARHRFHPSGCVQGSGSSETARNHQPITTLPGTAEDIRSALSALHGARVEDRPIEVGPPQGVSHHRDLRATPRQAHHSPLGKAGAVGDQVDGGREVVPRTEEGKPTGEGQAVCRSDDRQDPAHHAPGLQARPAARVSAATAGGQSHELGEPAHDQRLHCGLHDAEAGVRDSP